MKTIIAILIAACAYAQQVFPTNPKTEAGWTDNGTTVSTTRNVSASGTVSGSNLTISITAPPYNADPTGVTDSRAAIVAAIAAATAGGYPHGNRRVHIPSGIYRISSTITISPGTDPIWIEGDGGTRMGLDGSVLKFYGSGPAIVLSGAANTVFNRLESFSVVNASGGTATHGVKILNCNFTKIYHMSFSGFTSTGAAGLYLTGSPSYTLNVYIDSSSFSNNYYSVMTDQPALNFLHVFRSDFYDSLSSSIVYLNTGGSVSGTTIILDSNEYYNVRNTTDPDIDMQGGANQLTISNSYFETNSPTSRKFISIGAAGMYNAGVNIFGNGFCCQIPTNQGAIEVGNVEGLRIWGNWTALAYAGTGAFVRFTSNGLIKNYRVEQPANAYGFTANWVVLDPFGSGVRSVAQDAGYVATDIATNISVPSGNLSVTDASGIGIRNISTTTGNPRGILTDQFTTDTLGARLEFRKARGTPASPTTVVTGDNIGSLNAWPYDGTSYLEMSSIIFGTEGTIATNRTPTNIQFWTATDAGPSVLTEAMRITSARTVVIGPTSPGASLVVNGPGRFGDASKGVALQSNTNEAVILGLDIYAQAYNSVDIRANGTPGSGVYVSTNGSTGIGGTTFPGATLDVSKTSTYTARFWDQTATTGFTRVQISLGAADSATTVTLTNAGTIKAAGYQSSDGTAGATVTTCTGYKNGLCISGT